MSLGRQLSLFTIEIFLLLYSLIYKTWRLAKAMKRTEKTQPPHAMHPRSRLEHVTDVFSPTNAVT